jgi:hypothetical protein
MKPCKIHIFCLKTSFISTKKNYGTLKTNTRNIHNLYKGHVTLTHFIAILVLGRRFLCKINSGSSLFWCLEDIAWEEGQEWLQWGASNQMHRVTCVCEGDHSKLQKRHNFCFISKTRVLTNVVDPHRPIGPCGSRCGSESGSRVLMTKNSNKFTTEKKIATYP